MFPLKSTFKADDPLASIQANWLNTLANILNDIKGIGCHIDKPAGGEGMGWQIVIDDSDSTQNRPNRFLVVDQTGAGGGVLVYQGIWTRLGIPITLATDPGKEYETVSGIGANDYVYLGLTEAVGVDNDPALNPDYLQVQYGAANPNNSDDTNVYWVLGKFTSSVWKQYWVGDIDDFVAVPDGNSAYDVVGDYRFDSLNYATRAGWHNKNLQIFDWDSHGTATPTTADHFMFQDVSEDNKSLTYCTFETLADEIIGYINDNPGEVEHGNLGGLTDDDHGQYLWKGKSGADKAAAYARNSDSAEHNYLGNSLFIEGLAIVEGDGIRDSTGLRIQMGSSVGDLIGGDGWSTVDFHHHTLMRDSVVQASWDTAGVVDVGPFAAVNLNVVNGVYQHVGVDGVIIADRVGGGIDTGSTHEVRADELQPGDLILVRR